MNKKLTELLEIAERAPLSGSCKYDCAGMVHEYNNLMNAWEIAADCQGCEELAAHIAAFSPPVAKALVRFAMRVESRLTNSGPEQMAGDIGNALRDLRDALEEASDETIL